MRFALICLSAAVLTACGVGTTDHTQTPQWQFYQVNMKSLCGKTLTGKVVSTDPQDADWRGKTLTVGPVECTEGFNEDEIRMPLAVGEDTSRIWRLIPRKKGLLFNHTHMLPDGTPDPVSGYGGTANEPGTATRKDFPADDYSIEVFKANGLEASVTNVWTLEIIPGEMLVYELNREGRNFRAEFPL